MMFKIIIEKLKRIYYYSSSDRYCKYLINSGIKIGGDKVPS